MDQPVAYSQLWLAAGDRLIAFLSSSAYLQKGNGVLTSTITERCQDQRIGKVQ